MKPGKPKSTAGLAPVEHRPRVLFGVVETESGEYAPVRYEGVHECRIADPMPYKALAYEYLVVHIQEHYARESGK